MARNYSIAGFFEWASSFVPENLNIKSWLVDVFDILGAPQTLENIQELVDFHPLKMKKGQSFTIVDYPNGGVNTTYILNTDPALLIDGSENSIIELDDANKNGWERFYDLETSTRTSKDVVYQYSPNYLGGQPLYPYTTDDALRNERDGVWHAVQNKATGDKWFRTRDDDSFTMHSDPDAGPDIKVYDNWTRPLPFGSTFEPLDYINNKFKREVEGPTGISSAGSLVLDTFYLVVTGLVTATRVSDGFDFLHGEGATFEKTSAFTYVYTDAGTTCNTLPNIPSRTTASGAPNNEPAGYTDTIPAGTIQLWKIWAHKSTYGQLKSEWVLEKVVETPELLRYSRKSTPNPNTLMDVTDEIGDLYGGSIPEYIGLTFDEILDLEGWNSAYVEGQTDFIATRGDDGGSPPFTTWVIEKIGDESGEYTSYVYKLFEANTSQSTLLASKPVASDPSGEGFHDGAQEETGTLINFVSSSRKFFDGTLKTDWTDLVPFTGADIYLSAIVLPDGNDFKYDPNDPVAPNVPQPAKLRLYAQLHRGLSQLWKDADNTLAFKWEKTFDNGSAISPPTEIVSVDKADNAYVKSVSGITGTGTITSSATAVTGTGTLFTTEFVVGDLLKVASGQVREIAAIADNTNLTLLFAFAPDISVGEAIENSFMTEEEFAEEYRDGQILVINHAYITGKAYFRLTITLTTSEGDLVWTNIIDLLDITDGIDRKALEIGSDGQLCIYDTVNEVFNPPTFLLNAMFANLPFVTDFFWYFNNGSGYTAIDGTEANYDLTGAKDNVLSILIESLAVAKTGTVTTTGTAVLGVATLFTTEFSVGEYIKVSSGQLRKIVTITDALNIVVATAFSPDVSAETIEMVETLFDRNTLAEQLQIAISTHATDPTLADGENDLSDYLTIAKSSSAAIGTDGEDPPVAILTQETYTTVLDPLTEIPLVGELGTAGNVQTDVIVYLGATRLDYNAGDFVVVKVDPAGLTTEAVRVSPADSQNANIWIDSGGWDAGIRTGIIELTITLSAGFGSLVMVKEFALASTKDAPGAILLDIDSPQGFTFDRNPGGLVDKVLTARLFDVISGVQTELGPTNFYYQWSGPVSRSWTQGAGGSNGEIAPSITKASIFADAVVICEVSESVTGSPVLRQASVRITDITDSKTYRLYTTQVASPVKPINTTDPEATQGIWAKTQVGAVWASDGLEVKDSSNPPVYEFSAPYQIKGETGDIGPNGGFMLAMYKNVIAGTPATVPSSTATLAAMESDSWTYEPPNVVEGQYLWMAQRPFKAWQPDQTTPVSFDVNSKPDTNPMDGSLWIGPQQMSGFDGIDGDSYEFRYQKNTSPTVPPTLANGDRNPSGWTISYPSRTTGEYVWETKALINGDTDALIGTWITPTLKTGESIVGPSGPAPDHEWNGTSLRFRNPNGTWGVYVDLEGPEGLTEGPLTMFGADISSSGSTSNLWGPTTITAVRDSEGVYTLTHSLSSAAYSVILTSKTGSAGRIVGISSVSTNQIGVVIRGHDNSFQDTPFTVQVITH